MLAADGSKSVLLDSYLDHFTPLFGDSRTRNTFGAIVKGILTAGSLVCKRIAAQAPLLSRVRHGGLAAKECYALQVGRVPAALQSPVSQQPLVW